MNEAKVYADNYGETFTEERHFLDFCKWSSWMTICASRQAAVHGGRKKPHRTFSSVPWMTVRRKRRKSSRVRTERSEGRHG